MFDFDALLRLVKRREATELRLKSGASPNLIVGTRASRLALPASDAAWLCTLAQDLMGPDRVTALSQGHSVDFAYNHDELGSFEINVSGSVDDPMIKVRPEVDRTLFTIDPELSIVSPDQGLRAPDPLRLTLEKAILMGASDLHLGDADPALMRIRGELVPMLDAPVAGQPVRPLVEHILTPIGRRRLTDGLAVDFSFTVDGVGRFRGNAYRSLKGFNLAIRMLPEKIPTLKDLHLPKSLGELVEVPNGMILFTGPTGSGKSASMAALVDHVNRTRPVHIITLEDPIEFVHQRQRAVIRQREVGVHVASFAEGLRDALREDPDVILVGEMRDLETIQLALTAAETGHLVISTLHANRAASTIERIVDVFPEHRQGQVRLQLAESLRAVVAQRLLPRADGAGRVAALEVMRNNRAIGNHIREKRVHQIGSVMQTHREEGMWVLERHLAALVKREVIAEDVARLHTEDEVLFETYLRSA
mgnify:FL=1